MLTGGGTWAWIAHSDHADVIVRGGADDVSLHNCAGGEAHREFAGAGHHVVVGHDIARLIPDQSSSGLHAGAFRLVAKGTFAGLPSDHLNYGG